MHPWLPRGNLFGLSLSHTRTHTIFEISAGHQSGNSVYYQIENNKDLQPIIYFQNFWKSAHNIFIYLYVNLFKVYTNNKTPYIILKSAYLNDGETSQVNPSPSHFLCIKCYASKWNLSAKLQNYKLMLVFLIFIFYMQLDGQDICYWRFASWTPFHLVLSLLHFMCFSSFWWLLTISQTMSEIKRQNENALLKAFQVDLLSIQSIVNFKNSLQLWLQDSKMDSSVQLLINNAGILATSSRLTSEGYDQ